MGDFFIDTNSKSAVVLIAGGVGITPILSMAKVLANMESKREIHLFYGVRTSKELALKNEIEEMEKRLPNLKVCYCLSRPEKVQSDIRKRKLEKVQPRLEIDDGPDISVNAGGGIVGRSATTSDIIIQSNIMSRRHAQIIEKDDKWFIKDLGSVNGTFLNGTKLSQEEVQLKKGDVIQFSAYEAVVATWTFSEPEKKDAERTTNTELTNVDKFDFIESRVNVELFKQLLPSNNYDFYICGPGAMMSTITEDLKSWGVPSRKIHFESFGPASVGKKADKVPASDSSKTKIIFKASNITAAWDGSSSILELAEAHNVDIPSSCRNGNCGTCMSSLVEGDIEYASEPSATIDEGCFLACIAKPKGNLTVNA